MTPIQSSLSLQHFRAMIETTYTRGRMSLATITPGIMVARTAVLLVLKSTWQRIMALDNHRPVIHSMPLAIDIIVVVIHSTQIREQIT